MASANYIRTNLVLLFTVPTEDGDVTTKRITLSNVRADLTLDEISQIAVGLGGLMKHRLSGVERVLYEDIIY